MLLAAALFADILWPLLVLLKLEEVRIAPGNTAFTPLEFVSYPWSHSLLMLCVWGAVIGGAYRGIFGGRRTFVALTLLVISHWVLDWITHAPDMPLYPAGPKLGLGLWNSVPGTMVVELLMLAVGLFLYMRCTEAVDRIGRWALVSLGAVLTVIYMADSLSGAPPPSVTAVCVLALTAAIVFPAWAWLADRHRQPTHRRT
jgi:hypothetical protein